MKKSFNPPLKVTTESKIQRLKEMFEEDNKEKLEHLALLFSACRYLSADFVLDAVLTKLQRQSDGDDFDDVEDHMRGYFEEAYDLTSAVYAAWYFPPQEEKS